MSFLTVTRQEVTDALAHWRVPLPRQVRPGWDAWMQQQHRTSRPAIAAMGWLGFLLFYVLDAALYPATAADFLRMRLIVGALSAPVLIWLFIRPRSMVLQDVVQLLLIVLASALLMPLFMAPGSTSTVSAGYLAAALSFVVAISITAVARFQWALLATAIVGAQVLITLLRTHGTVYLAVLEFCVTFVPTTCFCLCVCWVRLTMSRRAYLHNLLKDMELHQLGHANQQLHIAAETDALTTIGNRRAFDRMLNGCITACGTPPEPFALLLLDIDYFKNYNDHYGHQPGDECLQRVAHCLRDSVRGRDTVAFRIGGEEFAVLATGINNETALQGLASRIVQAVLGLDITHPARPDGLDRLTISLGACLVQPSPQRITARAVMACADQYLYHSKHHGRNRFTTGLMQTENPQNTGPAGEISAN